MPNAPADALIEQLADGTASRRRCRNGTSGILDFRLSSSYKLHRRIYGPRDDSRAASAFGYKPTIKISQGIVSYAAWLASGDSLADTSIQCGMHLA
jgi:nucleoside-diphosphate-sugar epimerase